MDVQVLKKAKKYADLLALGIANVVVDNNTSTVTFTLKDGSVGKLKFQQPKNGVNGEDGVSVESIAKTSTSGLTDIYTITLSNGKTTEFSVTNGANGVDGKDGVSGKDGIGVKNITKTSTNGLVDVYTITLTNGNTSTFEITNGSNGKDGVGIVGISKTSTEGLVDTYTIAMSDGSTQKFTVTNGKDGENGSSGSGGGSYDDTELREEIQALKDIVNYVAPKINSFSMSPSTTTYEIGSKVSGLKFSWNLNKNVTSQSLTGCTIGVNDRSANYSSEISSNKTFTLSVSDGKNTANANKSINFYNKKYYGVATERSEYDSGFILGLNGSLVNSRTGNFTVNAGEGQYIYFAIPTSFGTPTFTIGGFSGGFDLVNTIDFTNASGYTTKYNIYRSTNANLGNTTVVVS